jgi:peptidoglycan/LPS O-acetylase OafA/YrhL
MATGRLVPLEYLRATCALVVMLNHTWCEGIGLPQYTPLVAIASYSIEAVMGFFVLSGCVISLQDYPDAGRYIRSRLVRIMPIYYVTLALAVAAMLFCHIAFGMTQLFADAFFLQTQDWPVFDPLRFFIPSWSLSYELYYYVAYIAIMAMPRLLLPLLAATIAAGVALYAFYHPAPPALWMLHVFAFFGMWLSGVLVTRLTRSGHAVSIGTGAFMLAVGLCLARVPLSSPSKFDYFRLAGFSVGFTFLVWAMISDALLPVDKRKSTLAFGLPLRAAIAAAALALFWLESDSHRVTKIALSAAVVGFTVLPEALAALVARAARPTVPFMTYVAGLSYALYLVHYPVVQTFNSLAVLPPLASFIVVVVLSFALAHLLDYRFQPWVRARLLKARPASASTSSSSMRT